MMSYWVYLARCADGSLYTGSTTDLKRRFYEHNQKARGAKYTASRLPVSLAQAWEVKTWSDALRLEAALKKCCKTVKEQLVITPDSLNQIAQRRRLDFSITVYPIL